MYGRLDVTDVFRGGEGQYGCEGGKECKEVETHCGFWVLWIGLS